MVPPGYPTKGFQMGAPITPNTPVGQRGLKIRRRLKWVENSLRAHPPEGVNPKAMHGGKATITVRGYMARSLYNFANEWAEAPFRWAHVDSCSSFLRGMLVKDSFGVSRQLDVVERWLPLMTTEIALLKQVSLNEALRDPEPEVDHVVIGEHTPIIPSRMLDSHAGATSPPEFHRPRQWPPDALASSMNQQETRTKPDDVEALAMVIEALDPLDKKQQQAIVNYVTDRFSL
jgi:hypothetical protein